MDVTSIGLEGFDRARARALEAGRELVEDGPEPGPIVDLASARRQAELAVELIEVGDELQTSLLDILA